MNPMLIVVMILASISIPLIIVAVHEESVTDAKIDQNIKNIRANETCAELKGDMIFTDKENEGHWIKSPYDSDVLKNFKEKHCS